MKKKYHLKTMIEKSSKGVNILRKLHFCLPRSLLKIIYNSFIRSLFDYADIIYDHSYNFSVRDRIESIQYNTALAFTVAIKDSSRDELYN